jgi:hypothetical protein
MYQSISCMHTHMHASTNARTHARTQAQTHTHTHSHTHSLVSTLTLNPHTHSNKHAHNTYLREKFQFASPKSAWHREGKSDSQERGTYIQSGERDMYTDIGTYIQSGERDMYTDSQERGTCIQTGTESHRENFFFTCPRVYVLDFFSIHVSLSFFVLNSQFMSVRVRS